METLKTAPTPDQSWLGLVEKRMFESLKAHLVKCHNMWLGRLLRSALLSMIEILLDFRYQIISTCTYIYIYIHLIWP